MNKSIVILILFVLLFAAFVENNYALSTNLAPIVNNAIATAANATSSTQDSVTTNVDRIVGTHYLQIPVDITKHKNAKIPIQLKIVLISATPHA